MIEKKFLTHKEAAEYCGYSYAYWRKIYLSLGLPVYKPTGRPRFNVADLDRLIERSRVN